MKKAKLKKYNELLETLEKSILKKGKQILQKREIALRMMLSVERKKIYKQ